MSITSAPGTAVLLMYGGPGLGISGNKQVVALLGGSAGFFLNRVCVKTFVYGGGHPGEFSSGGKNGECIARASKTGYACSCVLSRMPPDWKPAVIEFPIETYRANSGSTGMLPNGRFSWSSLQAAATRTRPRTAAENRLVRIMSRSSSERESYAGREQMGREVVETGVARGEIDGAAPVVLSDVLVREVGVEVPRQLDAGADRELVARGLGEQRGHELRRRGARVMQVPAAQLDL